MSKETDKRAEKQSKEKALRSIAIDRKILALLTVTLLIFEFPLNII